MCSQLTGMDFSIKLSFLYDTFIAHTYVLFINSWRKENIRKYIHILTHVHILFILLRFFSLSNNYILWNKLFSTVCSRSIWAQIPSLTLSHCQTVTQYSPTGREYWFVCLSVSLSVHYIVIPSKLLWPCDVS